MRSHPDPAVTVPPHRLRRSPASLRVAAALAAFLAVIGVGCDSWSDDPDCLAAPPQGVFSLWTECRVKSISAGAVELVMTNNSNAIVWFYHDCLDGEVPWPTQLQQDGTWRRRLPEAYSLPVSCEHVHHLLPGDTGPVTMSMQHVEGPGTYRAEMLIAFACGEVHDPLHVLHDCERTEFLLSEPFELR